jgi:hypothetical protein
MTETNWGTENEPPPKKKGLPTWLWFCGGGCLLAVVLSIILGAWLFSKAKEFVKESTDPEKQWPQLAQILPYDARPSELKLSLGTHIGADVYVFEDARGFAEIIFGFSETQGAEVRDKLMNPEYSGGAFGVGARKDLKGGTIRVQGRDLKVVRFRQSEKDSSSGVQAEVKVGAGPSILVDLTPDTGKRPVILQMVRLHSDEPITDEEVVEFLKPFHVGTER